ncbi:hypothetical protein L6452_44309 [Arctium lappa]|uniref:Uncharacterized protein n=1 Tax=Arctium lappa TaxID=4217 RepID=A0ACB8XH53_ARCLA|nr:hypothetical protein L6452_44309 [Arctium lappa]
MLSDRKFKISGWKVLKDVCDLKRIDCLEIFQKHRSKTSIKIEIKKAGFFCKPPLLPPLLLLHFQILPCTQLFLLFSLFFSRAYLYN